MALDQSPFGDYSGVAAGAGVTKASMATAFTNLLALIPEPEVDSGTVAPHPDFMRIPAETAALLRAEISALAAVVAAAV